MAEFPDITTALRTLSLARAGDLVGFIGRRLDEDRHLRGLPFREAWRLLLGEYVLMASPPEERDEVQS